MKKIFILSAFLALISCFAQVPIEMEISDGNGAVKAEWSPIQLGFLPHDYTQIFTEKTEIYGLSVGLFGLKQQKVQTKIV